MSPKPDLFRLPLGTRYALAAARFLAQRPARSYSLVDNVAAATGVPKSFLAKILQRMSHYGMLDSRRGPLGGYRLRKDASRITLADVVHAAEEGAPGRGECLAEARPCDPDRPCMLHPVVAACQNLLWDKLTGTPLSQYAAYRPEGARS